jgi:TonB C terminal
MYVGTQGRVIRVRANLEAVRPSVNSSESLVLVSVVRSGVGRGVVENAVSALPTLSKMKIRPVIDKEAPPVLDVEALTLGDDQASTSKTNDGREAEKAHWLGIYTGQIQARIDRIWRRPRSPVTETDADKAAVSTEDSFQCEAQIIQDPNGNVHEILLPRCNGSSAWQGSLVSAIRQASPLPAPPDPSVFSQSIILSFVGLPFAPGSSDDDYEIATPGPVSSVALARSQTRLSQ